MTTQTGYMPIHRKIVNWEWYTDLHTCKFFIHLLIKANHTENTFKGVTIKEGQYYASLATISKESGLSIQNIRTCIKKLKLTQELTTKLIGKNLLFTIVKYKEYKITNTDANTEVTSSQHDANTEVTPSNNEDNIKNNKNNNKYIYDGKIIKLVERDFNAWQKNYKHIPDLLAELQGLDDFYFSKGITKDWYMRCSAALASKNAKYKEATVKPIDKAHAVGIFMG